MTKWIDPPPADVPSSLTGLDLPPLVARTLVRRGLSDPVAARGFLDPDEYQPVSPSELPDMQRAIERLEVAIRRREKIYVWGDFDVDGQTATTLLVEALRLAGADVTYHIPIRAIASHGVHVPQLTELIDRGAQLILTCDTGVTAHAAVEYARSRGVDVLITDHHDPGETLPVAAAVVDPKLLPLGHPLGTLAGVGVAFKVAEALLQSRPGSTDALLDLVALGLIADLAQLTRDTRYLVQRGLAALRTTQRLGLQVIYEMAGIQPESLNETTVGFALGPRLNAIGRLGDANPVVELLTTRDPVRARVLATQIEGLNAQRRLLTDQVTQAAEAQLRADPSLLSQPAIVLGHAGWPGGVVGIVANRLVDRYHKPALLFNLSDDGQARGSARSIEGLHITAAIAEHKALLRNFGGHPMAAGLALEQANLPAFRSALNRTVEARLAAARIEEAVLEIDAWVELDALNLDLADAIEQLAPFGSGNPILTLATRGLRLKRVSQIGKNKEHLKFTVQDGAGREQSVLWWNADRAELPEAQFDLAYSVRAGSFRGARQITLEFVELRLAEAQPVEIRRAAPEVRDLRREPAAADRLGSQVLVWAEGEDRRRGQGRAALHPAKEFAIWTAPPSAAELRAALRTVRPQRVYLFAIPPPQEKPDDFLNRLAGLAKFAINQRGGHATLIELAMATAQREAAVRLGLEWLQAAGHIAVDGDDELTLAPGPASANPYAQQEILVAVKGLLEETAAYRRYLAATAEPERLLEH